MRYLLHKQLSNEVGLRLTYLFDVFKLWFVRKENIGCFIVLESFPSNIARDTLIVYGHNYEVQDLFHNHANALLEQSIYLITCATKKDTCYKIPNKRIYLASQMPDGLHLHYGKEFGFEFDITDIELWLYNSKINNINEKLLECFTRQLDKVGS